MVKQGASAPVPGGCHDSRADAIKHQRALYANEPSVTAAITASVFPLHPPIDWFQTPEADGPTPLTITADGQVFGHLALWDQCHTGFQSCTRAPRSRSGYSAFHVGTLTTAEGEEIPVGRLVYGGSHASLEALPLVASQHYDRTGSVGAFVRASDGRYGVWLSGAVRSDISPEGLRDLRANPPSGDWREIDRNLELVAALAVPVPGFPVAREQMALAASGEVQTMILPGYTEEEAAMSEPRSKSFIRRRSMVAATLTAKKRKSLSRGSFAIPETRSYPIHDEAHARNALARSSGKPEEGRVRRAVCRRYPNMGECSK